MVSLALAVTGCGRAQGLAQSSAGAVLGLEQSQVEQGHLNLVAAARFNVGLSSSRPGAPQDCPRLPPGARATMNGARLSVSSPDAQWGPNAGWECMGGEGFLPLEQVPRRADALRVELSDDTATWAIEDPWFFTEHRLVLEGAAAGLKPGQTFRFHFEPIEATLPSESAWGFARRSTGENLYCVGAQSWGGAATLGSDNSFEASLPAVVGKFTGADGAEVPSDDVRLWVTAGGLARLTCEGGPACVARRHAELSDVLFTPE